MKDDSFRFDLYEKRIRRYRDRRDSAGRGVNDCWCALGGAHSTREPVRTDFIRSGSFYSKNESPRTTCD